MSQIDLPPELGPPTQAFGPDRTIRVVLLGLGILLAALAVLFFWLCSLNDPPPPIPKGGRLRYYLPSGLGLVSVVAFAMANRAWNQRVFLCPNGLARVRNGEAQWSRWVDLAVVECSLGEPRPLSTDRISLVDKNGARWSITTHEIGKFRTICEAIRVECEQRGIAWRGREL